MIKHRFNYFQLLKLYAHLAPPESFKPMTGAPTLIAISITLHQMRAERIKCKDKIDNFNKDKNDGSEIGMIIDFKKAEESKTYSW